MPILVSILCHDVPNMVLPHQDYIWITTTPTTAQNKMATNFVQLYANTLHHVWVFAIFVGATQINGSLASYIQCRGSIITRTYLGKTCLLCLVSTFSIIISIIKTLYYASSSSHHSMDSMVVSNVAIVIVHINISRSTTNNDCNYGCHYCNIIVTITSHIIIITIINET
jgi:hypothetical protein